MSISRPPRLNPNVTLPGAAMVEVSFCYHCAEPVPPGSDYTVEIDGAQRAMCCPGCQAVASAIVDGGLARFYQYRTEASERPEDETPPSWQIYEIPDIQQDFVIELDNAHCQASVLLEGTSCAACSWLIRSEEHTSELQSRPHLVCRLLLEEKD